MIATSSVFLIQAVILRGQGLTSYLPLPTVLIFFSQTGRLTDSVWGEVWGQGRGNHAPSPWTDKLTDNE